jgi:cell division protein FtsW
MLFALTILLLFIGHARMMHLVGMIFAAVCLFALYVFFMAYVLKRPYQLERIMHFVHGSPNGQQNYQLWQGIIGFGNGGLFGVGPGESRQRDLFLPESYNDFVYSIVGEEYGFVGTLIVLGTFLFVLLRGFRIAKHAKDDFARFLASVALGLLPTTGLPMPFVSYGGSSLMFSAFSVGVLLNISAHTDLHPRIAKKEKANVDVLEPETGLGKVY